MDIETYSIMIFFFFFFKQNMYFFVANLHLAEYFESILIFLCKVIT